ncbi:hypothetical protein B0H14DRAFT_2603635 [Mycena olivaceomarginata]|nr:hypothetical protein B0H14DRAFT_2603635 [Mycena olivaceomarginata]
MPPALRRAAREKALLKAYVRYNKGRQRRIFLCRRPAARLRRQNHVESLRYAYHATTDSLSSLSSGDSLDAGNKFQILLICPPPQDYSGATECYSARIRGVGFPARAAFATHTKLPDPDKVADTRLQKLRQRKHWFVSQKTERTGGDVHWPASI